MKKVRVAINGLGRIGRAFLRAARERDDMEIVGVNDLGDIENLAYLLRYDSAYGKYAGEVIVGGLGDLSLDGKPISFTSIHEPEKLPWRDLRVDVVVEATGVFASFEKSRAHLSAGAKRVVITAPVTDHAPDGRTILMGVNDDTLASCVLSSNASCTTNAASPVIEILRSAVGIEKALLATVHGYTASQALVDAPDAKDFRRGRAAAANIIPSSTGAADAVTEAIPALAGKFDGIAFRVPVLTGSIVDLTFISSRDTSADEINEVLERASREKRWTRVFSVTREPLVSSDIIGSPYASIADLSLTRVADGTLAKVCAWYDNEMGYAHALLEHVAAAGAHFP